jgi:hypothetical protein
VLTTAVFTVAVFRGQGGVTTTELMLVAVAAAGIAGWLLLGEPVVATACVVAADLIAAAMMTPKTYRDPTSETLVTFVGASISGALAAGAVGAVDAALLIYPIYYCLANGALALLIQHRRTVLGHRNLRGDPHRSDHERDLVQHRLPLHVPQGRAAHAGLSRRDPFDRASR